MKILSFQPCSIYVNGGMGRLLRRIYEGHEDEITCLSIIQQAKQKKFGNINEVIVTQFPLHRTWMRWKVRNLFIFFREKLFKNFTVWKLINEARKIEFDVLHVINHGNLSTSFCKNSFLKGKKLWTSFHDHFLTIGSSFENTKLLWCTSDRRLVISVELGLEYQKLFGIKDFELITDGVRANEISKPNLLKKDEIEIYFAGLLHLEYYPLFLVLAETLDLLADQKSITLTLRGTGKLKILENRKFKINYRRDFISDAEIKKEMDKADILYLPIKFSVPEFYLFSLSTKMVGYLGAAGNILYHGPADSAACTLLKKSNAAVMCNSLNKYEMLKSINTMLNNDIEIKQNAVKLALEMFDIDLIQKKFWKTDLKIPEFGVKD